MNHVSASKLIIRINRPFLPDNSIPIYIKVPYVTLLVKETSIIQINL